jgi:large subunit ribosomal protein L10
VLTRTQKEEQVAELKEKFGRATSVYVMDYRGLDVESANTLRRRIRSEGAGDFEYRVAKNAVLKLASVDSDIAVITPHFVGPTSVAISYGDPVGLAKILSEFAEDHDVFDLKGGVVDGEALDAIQIAALAKLPSLDALRGMIVGLIQAPATKLVRLLVEPGTQLARLVDARKSQLEEGEAA